MVMEVIVMIGWEWLVLVGLALQGWVFWTERHRVPVISLRSHVSRARNDWDSFGDGSEDKVEG